MLHALYSILKITENSFHDVAEHVISKNIHYQTGPLDTLQYYCYLNRDMRQYMCNLKYASIKERGSTLYNRYLINSIFQWIPHLNP